MGEMVTRKPWICICAAVAMCAAAGQARAQSDSSRIAALEHSWLAARDTITLDRILDSSFVHVTPQGVFLDKQEHVAWMASHWPPPDREARFERLDVRVFGGTAIATGIVTALERPDGLERRTAFTDVFIDRQGTWQAVSAQEAILAPTHSAGAHP